MEKPEAAKLLLMRGIDVSIADGRGRTAFFAPWRGADIPRLLLEQGADLFAVDRQCCQTALHVRCHAETAALLLDYGIDLAAVDVDGKTALQVKVAEMQDSESMQAVDDLENHQRVVQIINRRAGAPGTGNAGLSYSILPLTEGNGVGIKTLRHRGYNGKLQLVMSSDGLWRLMYETYVGYGCGDTYDRYDYEHVKSGTFVKVEAGVFRLRTRYEAFKSSQSATSSRSTSLLYFEGFIPLLNLA